MSFTRAKPALRPGHALVGARQAAQARASIAGRIGIIAAGRRRRSRVVRVAVGVIVGAGGPRSDRRGAEAERRRSDGDPTGMTVPGAMPSAAVAASDESPAAITARGEPVDEQGSGTRRLRQAP